MRRKIQHRKKKPLIVICSEGGKHTSEEIYFKNFKNRNFRIQFSSGNSTDSKGMLEDLKKYIKKEDLKSEDTCFIYLIIDTDLDNEKIEAIKSIENKCKNYNIEIITSSPTFEIWYLMHFRNNKLTFSSSKDVKKEIEKLLGKYTESMNVFPYINDKLERAIKNAKTIDTKVKNNNEDLLMHNPHSSIFKIIEKIKEYH